MARLTTLTPQIATDLETLWQLSGDDTITDEEICFRLGVKFGSLRGWLQRNRRVERDGIKRGLRDIRNMAKATTKSSYLQRLFGIMVKAEAAGDLRTAANVLQWMMEKQFPIQFGNRLKLSGRVETGADLLSMTDAEIKEQLNRDLAELAGRAECQEFVNQLKTSLPE